MTTSLTRQNLRDRIVEPLSLGGFGNPDVYLVEDDLGPVVVKDFAGRAPWLRSTWGRWMIVRELRAYAALEGLPSMPRVLGSLDALAFVLEYRPGQPLARHLAPQLSAGFVDELRHQIHAMHDRGVVHLDLRHRSNVLAGDDGHPVLIDFASAVCFRPGGWAHRTLQPALAAFDRAALRKWESRLVPPA